MKKDSYPLPWIQEALESLVSTGYFSWLDLKSGFWQMKMGELLKQYTTFTAANLGFFECSCMPFGLCNMSATFQRLMQNCLGEPNLTYCLIYLDDIIVFSQTAEEHLHCLYVVFDWFREHNLKLKLFKCDLFRNEITYLAHWVSKDRICPSNSNLEAIAECTLSRHTPRCALFSVWWATTAGSSRDSCTSHSHLVSISLERGPARSKSRCHRGCQEGFQSIETGMHDSPHPGVHWLHQAIPVADWCIQRWIGHGVVTEAGRQVVPSHCLWQQGPDATWEKLSLHQTQVPSIKMGSYRAP